VGVVLGDASAKFPPIPEEITIDPPKAVSPMPPSIVTTPPHPDRPDAPTLFVKIDMLPELVAVPEPEEITIDPPEAVSPTPPSIVTPSPHPDRPDAPALIVEIDMLPKLVAVPEPEEKRLIHPRQFPRCHHRLCVITCDTFVEAGVFPDVMAVCLGIEMCQILSLLLLQ